MKKHRLHVTSTVSRRASWDDMYEEMAGDWHEKARRLQARRWRALKREMRGR